MIQNFAICGFLFHLFLFTFLFGEMGTSTILQKDEFLKTAFCKKNHIISNNFQGSTTPYNEKFI